jgi:hypothetical protein
MQPHPEGVIAAPMLRLRTPVDAVGVDWLLEGQLGCDWSFWSFPSGGRAGKQSATMLVIY